MSDSPAALLERWSPVDALRIVVSATVLLLILLVDRLFGDELVSFISDVLAGFRTIDEDVIPVIAVVARIATLGVLGVGLVSATLRGHWRFLLTAAAGAAVGAGLVTLIDGLLDASAPAVATSDEFLGLLGRSGFPTAAGLAAITGAVAAGVPWFERRERRVGWALVVLLAFVRAFTEPVSLQTVAALACGALAGALADAVLGTPSRRPTQAAVVEGLTRSGVELADLHPASVDARGSTPYFGTTTDDSALFVKALGADERKADLLFRLVRTAMPRDLGDERPFSSLRRAVEHEAFVALAAAHVGVRTPPLAAFASAEPGGFVLAYVAIDGRSLDGVDPDEITDERPGRHLGADGHPPPPRHRPPGPAPGQRVPGGGRRGVDDRLRLQRAGGLGPAPGQRPGRAGALPEPEGRRRAGRGRGRTGRRGRGAPGLVAPVRPEVPQRGDPHGPQGAPRAPDRGPVPHRDGGLALRRTQALALAGAGATAFALSSHFAVDDGHRRVESRVFHVVNGSPDWLYPVLWGPMQLGNLVVGAVVALAVALVGRRPKVALAALAAVGLKLVVERVIRDRLTVAMDRQRPGTSQVGAVLRGDVPVEGHSFPSGHVILVAALAAVLTPDAAPAVVGPARGRRWAWWPSDGSTSAPTTPWT